MNLPAGTLALAEPSTLATDYLLGGFAAVLGIRLWREGSDPGRLCVRLWAAALLAVAAAALAGGTWHGFHPHVLPLAAGGLWKLTLLATGVASFLVLAGSAFATLSGAARRTVLVLAGTKLGVYIGWLAGHDRFAGVVVDYGTAMLAVLALHGWAWHRRWEPASPWMAAGVAISALAAGIQGSGIVLTPLPQRQRYLPSGADGGALPLLLRRETDAGRRRRRRGSHRARRGFRPYAPGVTAQPFPARPTVAGSSTGASPSTGGPSITSPRTV